MRKKATISDCKNYRYKLSRIWDKNKPKIVFIGINPSTADDKEDDPTIRKLIAYSKAWGYGGFIIINLFAFRTAKVYDLLKIKHHFGPENENYLRKYTGYKTVVVMWGAKANEINRYVAKRVLNMIENPMCFGKNADGSPKHPLFMAPNVKLQKYR